MAYTVPYYFSADTIDNKLINTAKTMNAQLPLRLDDDMVLTGVFAAEKKMHIIYTLNHYKSSEIDGDILKKDSLAYMIDSVCFHPAPSINDLLNEKVTIVFHYKGNDGKKITQTYVDKQICSLYRSE